MIQLFDLTISSFHLYMFNMQLIDSHSHIDFSEFDLDRRDTICRAVDAGVSDIIVSATTSARWELVKKVCDEYSQICHPAYGLHPMFMSEHKTHQNTDGKSDSENLKLYLKSNHAVAIGEIGLDFFIPEADQNNKKAQLELFISQLRIAAEMELPVIIHARKSLDIVLKHLRNFPTIGGSIHSFSGSMQQAKQLIELGFNLGFGGPITYSRATRLHSLIRELPLEVLLLESDAPDQPDSSHYLQRNEPAYIIKVIEKIAELKKIDVELVARKTTQNAIELFNLGTD